MAAAFGIVLIGMAVLLAEIPPLKKQGQFMGIGICILLTASACALGMLTLGNRVVPNPLDWIKALYEGAGLALRS